MFLQPCWGKNKKLTRRPGMETTSQSEPLRLMIAGVLLWGQRVNGLQQEADRKVYYFSLACDCLWNSTMIKIRKASMASEVLHALSQSLPPLSSVVAPSFSQRLTDFLTYFLVCIF